MPERIGRYVRNYKFVSITPSEAVYLNRISKTITNWDEQDRYRFVLPAFIGRMLELEKNDWIEVTIRKVSGE